MVALPKCRQKTISAKLSNIRFATAEQPVPDGTYDERDTDDLLQDAHPLLSHAQLLFDTRSPLSKVQSIHASSAFYNDVSLLRSLFRIETLYYKLSTS